MTTRKPLIQVEERSPFGEDFDEEVLSNPGRDSTWIDGYSDVRIQRELALRKGERPDPLRHRLHWVTAKSLDNTRADKGRVEHWRARKRYQPLKYQDAIQLGYRVDQNMAITEGEDGLAYLGNQVLMIADARVAAANYKKVQEDTRELADQPRRKMEAAVEDFNRASKGAHAESFAYIGDDDPDEIAKGKKKKK